MRCFASLINLQHADTAHGREVVDAARLEREGVRGQVSGECAQMAILWLQAVSSAGMRQTSYINIWIKCWK